MQCVVFLLLLCVVDVMFVYLESTGMKCLSKLYCAYRAGVMRCGEVGRYAYLLCLPLYCLFRYACLLGPKPVSWRVRLVAKPCCL